MTIYQCKHCDFTTENKSGFGSHVFWTHKRKKLNNSKSATTCAAQKQERITKYYHHPKLCQYCNTAIPYDKKVNNFCSQSCSAKYSNSKRNNSGWKMSSEAKDKISTTLTNFYKCTEPRVKISKIYSKTCAICGNFYTCSSVNSGRQTCSTKCMSILLSNTAKERYKNSPDSFFKRDPSKQSYMESSFEKWLISLGIKNSLKGYLMELHFWDEKRKRNGWLDFYFPKLKLVIELDGSHHIKRAEIDKERDFYLSQKGLTVFRISQEEYRRKTKLQDVLSLLSPLII